MSKIKDDFYVMSEIASQFTDSNGILSQFALKLDCCPVCDGKKFKKLFNLNNFLYYQCLGCTFVFTNPRLNDEGSSLWYNSDYYNAALSTEMFLNKEEKNYISSLNRDGFESAVNMIGVYFKDKDIKILDAGCSTGTILAYLKNELGYNNLTGIDLNKRAVDFAKSIRSLNVYYKDITSLNKEDSYDLVINTENIEHVNSLEKYIINLRNVLNKGGHILITTPNNDLKILKLLKDKADHFNAPNHYNYFNSNTIRKLLERYGFEIVTIQVSSRPGPTILSIIKRWGTKRDWVIAFPPNHAYFKKRILKNYSYKQIRDCVKLKEIEHSETSDFGIKTSNPPKKSIFKKMIRSILSFRPVKKHHTNLLVLAKLKD